MSAVSEIMSSSGVVTLDGSANPTALDAANAMVKNRVGSVIVLQSAGGRPEGIITERDLLKKVSAHNKRPQDVPAKSIMSSPLITVRAFDSVDTAAGLMSKNKVKRLPVLEQDGSIAGMLSVTDIARRLAKIMEDDYSRYRSLRAMLMLEGV
jgi:CBS domain-containing protein